MQELPHQARKELGQVLVTQGISMGNQQQLNQQQLCMIEGLWLWLSCWPSSLSWDKQS